MESNVQSESEVFERFSLSLDITALVLLATELYAGNCYCAALRTDSVVDFFSAWARRRTVTLTNNNNWIFYSVMILFALKHIYHRMYIVNYDLNKHKNLNEATL